MSQVTHIADRIVERINSTRKSSDYLGVGESTMEAWRRKGVGPKFIRLSARRIGYRQSDLDAWLREREAGVAEGSVA